MSQRERPLGAATALDEVSKSIIEQLQQDGRRSYATIAQAVGLSEAAVRQRVQRLLKSGVIQIVAVTDPLQLGFPRQAMIGIRVEGDIETVADELEKFPEVDYVVVTAGQFDLVVEVVAADRRELLDLTNKMRALDGVMTTEIFFYLEMWKQLYDWGTRE